MTTMVRALNLSLDLGPSWVASKVEREAFKPIMGMDYTRALEFRLAWLNEILKAVSFRWCLGIGPRCLQCLLYVSFISISKLY